VRTDFHLAGENIAYTLCLNRGRIYWLDSIAVKPAFQNRGIGKFALKTLLQDFRQKTIATLARPHLEAEGLSLDRLIKFYASEGFQVLCDPYKGGALMANMRKTYR
jgi:GNAT superfamily N-acetyltransferase